MGLKVEATGIKVGKVVGIMKAWGTYQDKLNFYRSKLVEADENDDLKEVKYWQDTIDMTKVEIGEFLNMVI